jgi:hypothetical protein
MAEYTHTNEHAHDYMAVQSRVSWGAIMAGAVVSLALYLIMSLLGAAIGLSVTNASFSAAGLSTGAGFWAVLTTIVALFCGAWVTSQAVIGESKCEAMIHSVIMWGVVMAMIMWLVASGARAGFGAMVGFSQFADNAGLSGMVADTHQRANAAVSSAERSSNDLMNNPSQREALRSRAAQATWWALGGTVLSILAAVGGGLVGGGTSFRWIDRGLHHHHPGGQMATGMGI